MSSPRTCEPGERAGPLSGVRIVDLTSALSGPLATHFPALLGADVIKVEPPEGDVGRQMGRAGPQAGMSALHLQTNQGKRSLSLDLRTDAGREVLMRLVSDADALVHNMRSAAAGRLGLAPDELHRHNPRLVVLTIGGYATTDPRAGLPAYDDVIQGATALPWLVGEASGGEEGYVPIPLADRLSGTLGFGYLAAALLASARDGRGRSVHLPMFEALAHMVLSDHLQDRTTDPAAVERGHPRLLGSHRRPFNLRDGTVCLQPTTDAQWLALLTLVGRKDLAADPRLQDLQGRLTHAAELDAALRHALAERETGPFLDACSREDVPASPLVDIDTLSRDPNVENGRLLRRVDQPSGTLNLLGLPGCWSGGLPPPAAAPVLGAQSRRILSEIDYAPDEIDRLVDEGIVIVPDARRAA